MFVHSNELRGKTVASGDLGVNWEKRGYIHAHLLIFLGRIPFDAARRDVVCKLSVKYASSIQD